MTKPGVDLKPFHEVIKPCQRLEIPKLSNSLGISVTLLCENFQHTGSFKFRAAYYVALNVPQTTLITVSSGNFGQALAYACQLLGKSCHVIMPDNATRSKIEATRDFGASVYLVDTRRKGRSDYLMELAAVYPEAYVASPYDDPWVIEGNASLGSELARLEPTFDDLIVPIGGGGLSAGLLVGLRKMGRLIRVTGAEPLMANDAAQSLRQGYRVVNATEPETIADGARTPSLGKLNWPILEKGLERIIEIPESTIRRAVQLLYHLGHLKVEPTGALSVAALLTAPDLFQGKKVGCIISGGNIDDDVFQQIVAQD